MWDTFKEGLQPQPLHDIITKAQHALFSPKIHCHLHMMYYSIRVRPNAHPQHIKVPKHFAYIWYGYELLSTEVWSLYNDIKTSYRGSALLKFSKNDGLRKPKNTNDPPN
jgi:hypothetical protein